MNEYDDITENIHRCFGSLDHVFNAGRSEREAAAEVKRALETQGVSKDTMHKIIGDYLLESRAPVRSIEETIAEAMSFFFDEPEPTVARPSSTSPNPDQPTKK